MLNSLNTISIKNQKEVPPPRAHACEEKIKQSGSKPPVRRIVSIEEVDNKNDQTFNEKEKLDLSGPLLENVIPTEWLQDMHFVRGTKGNQMDVTLQITTLDTQSVHTVTALLDTGCTGSSIDSGFVKKYGINTRKLYAPIPVYNADGSHNTGGPITDYVELHVKVQDHLERLIVSNYTI